MYPITIGVAPLAITPARAEAMGILADPSIRSPEALLIVDPAYIRLTYNHVNLLAYVTVFSRASWGVMGIVCVVVCATFHQMRRARSMAFVCTPTRRSVVTSLGFIYGVILQLDVSFRPRGLGKKAFLMTAWIFSIVMMAHYEAMITSFMTQGAQIPRIQSFEDAVHLGYQVFAPLLTQSNLSSCIPNLTGDRGGGLLSPPPLPDCT